MEKFIEEQISEEGQEFEPYGFYNEAGDCIEVYLSGDLVVEDRINEIITIYRSQKDNQPIGFQIKGVKDILEEWEAERVGFHAATKKREDKERIELTELTVAAISLSSKDEKELEPEEKEKMNEFQGLYAEAERHGDLINA